MLIAYWAVFVAIASCVRAFHAFSTGFAPHFFAVLALPFLAAFAAARFATLTTAALTALTGSAAIASHYASANTSAGSQKSEQDDRDKFLKHKISLFKFINELDVLEMLMQPLAAGPGFRV